MIDADSLPPNNTTFLRRIMYILPLVIYYFWSKIFTTRRAWQCAILHFSFICIPNSLLSRFVRYVPLKTRWWIIAATRNWSSLRTDDGDDGSSSYIWNIIYTILKLKHASPPLTLTNFYIAILDVSISLRVNISSSLRAASTGCKCKVTRSESERYRFGRIVNWPLADLRCSIVHVPLKYSSFQLDCNYVVYEAMYHDIGRGKGLRRLYMYTADWMIS